MRVWGFPACGIHGQNDVVLTKNSLINHVIPSFQPVHRIGLSIQISQQGFDMQVIFFVLIND